MFDDLEWYHWVIILIIVAIIIILIMLYWYRAELVDGARAHGHEPTQIPGYTGGMLPWDVVNDINAINLDGCQHGYNPSTRPKSVDGEVIC